MVRMRIALWAACYLLGFGGFRVPAVRHYRSCLFRTTCFLPGPEIYKCIIIQASAVLNQLYEGDDGQSSPNLKNEYQLKVH
jgi:hypothetical protein